MTYKIEFGSWPLEGGGLFFHNFLVLRDDTGRVISELNGGGADADGSFNYTATSGPIAARHTNYAEPPNPRDPRFAVRRNSTFIELFSGTQQEVLNRWKAGAACAKAIESKKIPYALPGPNSNSVAGTVAKCMNLKQPFVAPNDFSKPGSQRQLLTDGEINGIRSQLNLPPVNDGTVRDAPDFEEPEKQGAVPGMPQGHKAQAKGGRLAVRSTDEADSPGAFPTLIEDGRAIENGAVGDRMSAIQGLMGDRSSEYWRGPKADVLQEEYRDLIGVRDRNKVFDGSLIPKGYRTATQPSIDADAPANFESKAAFDRMAEIEGLMADRHSEYWAGPKADALQEEYRGLVERRNRSRTRDDEFSLFAL